MTKQELGEIIMSSKGMFYRVSKTILVNDSDCEEATSEMIVSAFAGLKHLKDDRYVRTWLTRILINKCYDILRKRREDISYDDALDSRAGEDHGYSDLYVSLQQLDEDSRVVIVLYYLEGYKLREIAQILEIPEGTVKSRLSRGMVKLRNEYESIPVIHK